MALQLSRREVDDLKSSIDRAIYRTIGKSDSSLLSTVSSCLVNGYERRKFIDKISSHIESKKASKLADKVIALAEELVANAKSSSHKRKHEDLVRDKDKERGSTDHKRSRSDKQDKHDSKDSKSESRHESKQDAKRDSKPDKEREKEKEKVKEKEPEPLPYLAKPEDKLEGHNGSAVISMELPLPPPILGEGETIGNKIAGLSADRIKLMMANAQKEISERKRALQTLTANANANANASHTASSGAANASAAAARAASVTAHVARATIAPPSLIKPQLFAKPELPASVTADELEKQKKIAELQARIQRKLAGGALKQTSTDGPAPLILDREGRSVDTSGRIITQLTQVAPTLKANIRAKRRTEFRAQLSAASASTATETLDARFLDPRVGAKPPTRAARPLKFHEPGKFVQMADRLRMKAQLEKLQGEISQIARKTGISSATKLALLSAETAHDHHIPDIEWWDSVILMTPDEREARRHKIAKRATNVIDLTDDPSDDVSPDPRDDRSDEQRVDACNTGEDDILQNLNDEAITELVEHPQQLRPPTEPLKPPLMPVFLTPRERKKLRRQSRREAWKEEQEKVRLGLEAPPEPKLRISNLMRALGTEAVQDPTAIEAKVREQIAKRQKTHQDANQARALTKEQRKDKIDSKIREDTSMGVHVGVYRIKDLFECASAKFKVEKNAQQLHMTGCVLLHRGCCVVVVEGGPKQHSKYKRLMLQRIKWQEATVKDTEGQDVPNECRLVWEGVVKQRAFGDIKFKVCPTEKLAREHFQKHKVEHYWDLAYSAAVLGSAVEDP